MVDVHEWYRSIDSSRLDAFANAIGVNRSMVHIGPDGEPSLKPIARDPSQARQQLGEPSQIENARLVGKAKSG